MVVRWSLIGWGVMSLFGVIGGSWMAAVHGRPGASFVGALVGCLLARMIAAALGALGAASIGYPAAWPYVIGLGAGYLPLQLFEAGWFLTQGKARVDHDRN